MSDDPRPDQTLPDDLDDDDDTEETEGDLTVEKAPPGQDPDKVRGRSAEAHERAPGQNKPE